VNRLRWILGGLGLLYGLSGAVFGFTGATAGPGLLVLACLVTGACYALAWLRITILPMPVLLGLTAAGAAVMHLISPYSGLAFAFTLPWLTVFSVSLRAVIAIGLLDAAGVAAAGTGSIPPAGTVGMTFGLLFSFAFAVAIQQLSVVRDRTEAAAQARASEAVLGERQRLAREVHDVLAHSLSAQLLHLEGAALLLEQGGPPEQALAHVRRASRLARDGLTETKQALRALRGDDLDVEAQIQALASEFRAATGSSCESILEPVALAADARLAIVRTAQEALTNIRRHAPGANAVIRLRQDGQWCELEVLDFGSPERIPASVGLALAEAASAGAVVPGAGGQHSPGVGRAPMTRSGMAGSGEAGYGLVGMRERAELIGGTLLASAQDNGFRVLLRLPVGEPS
jgi:signal transduction histidine kinase